MATSKEIISFSNDGVKYTNINAIKLGDNRYSVRVADTAKMIRQYVEQKYPMFSKKGVMWIRSSKFFGSGRGPSATVWGWCAAFGRAFRQHSQEQMAAIRRA